MKEENIQCPFCDVSPTLKTLERQRAMDFEGVPTTVHGLLYSQCPHCGMETITPQQTRKNKRTIIEAHKKALDLLTAEEILQLRHQLGITQNEAAKLFGGGANAFSKYENNSITQTKSMDNELRLVLEVPGAAEYLANRAGVHLRSSPKKLINEKRRAALLKLYTQHSINKLKPEQMAISNVSIIEMIQHVQPQHTFKNIRQLKKPASPHNVDKTSQENIVELHDQLNTNWWYKQKAHTSSPRRPYGRQQKLN